jgi:hypothetical protein
MLNKQVFFTLHQNKLVWTGSLFFVGIGFLLFMPARITYVAPPTVFTAPQSKAQEAKPTTPLPIYFTGDIMLARHVEVLDRQGKINPIDFITLFASSTAVVVNFESAMAEPHVSTQSGAMQFSTAFERLPLLSALRVSHASLANNHSRDYGKAGRENAITKLHSVGITAFGDAVSVSSSSIAYIQQGSTTISLIGIHTLFSEPERDELVPLLALMSSTSDVQIPYIHWGDEYELMHNDTQERLAALLVELGADAIIAHHPHVTQDIQLINGVPVFYSLGNFIFDQYFKQDVKEGYVLGLIVTDKTLDFTIIPHEQCALATPCRMTATHSQLYLEALSKRSGSRLGEQIMARNIVISR